MALPSTHQEGKQVVMEEAQHPQAGSPTVTGAKRRHAIQGEQSPSTKKFSKKQRIQQGAIPLEDRQVSKLLLPRYIDMEDQELLFIFSKLHELLEFQRWIQFVSKYRVYYLQPVL